MKKFKSNLFILFFLFTILKINAQIGIGTTNPQGALDITSSTDGLLIPRVALTDTTIVLPVLTGTASELVYNTATVNDVTPGFYFLSTPTGPWVRLGNGSTDSWLITGNTNIVDGTNFLGTAASTDVDVAFRRNNLAAGRIGTTSTSFGLGALSAGAATNSTAFGNNALTVNTTGTDNVAVGNGSLAANITGAYNTAIGTSALAANTANGNTAVGFTALTTNTGGDNTAVGYQALKANTTGIQNTAVGVNALQQKTIGSANTAIGHGALSAVGTFDNVTALGFQAGLNNTASNNTLLGFQAGNAVQAQRVVAVGFQAGAGLRAPNTIAIGANAFDGNLDPASQYSIAIGAEAMGNSTGVAAHNVAIGWQALLGTTASNNVAIGTQACGQVGAGIDNVAVGYNAMAQGNSQQNVAIGRSALMESPGNGNTAVGHEAGRTSPGSNNTFIGYQTNGTGTTTNTTSIGYQANCIADNQVTLGNGSVTTLRCGTSTITAISDRRDKANIKKLSEGIDFIKKLKPVSFTWNTRDKLKVGIKAAGFIAQDLLELQKHSSIGDNLDLVDDENPDRYEARYGNLLPVMISGMQEQQELIEKLQKANEELLKMNEKILKRLEKLEKK